MTVGLSALALLASLSAGCSGSKPSKSASASPSGSSTKTRAETVTELLGIGATVAAYEHARPRGSHGYGAPISLDGSRVLAYVHTLPAPVTATAAKVLLMNDVPVDARIVSQLTLAACEQLWIHSDMISSVLGPGGFVVVKLSSSDPTSYDAAKVSVLTFDHDLHGGPGSLPC